MPVASTVPTSSTRSAPLSTTPTESVVVSPEFVQGVIPGAEISILVGQDPGAAGTATVRADAQGAAVQVSPPLISGDEIAEVIVVPEPTAAETELAIEIQVETADGAIHTTTRTATVHPWEDDRAAQAEQILRLFTPWLEETRPELGIDAATSFRGTYLAPELLVVSHYGVFDERWEVGVSWHVMIPPDDFAEIYLRERTELRPSLAFRIGSWQTALEGADYEILEVAPPSEVVR